MSAGAEWPPAFFILANAARRGSGYAEGLAEASKDSSVASPALKIAALLPPI